MIRICRTIRGGTRGLVIYRMEIEMYSKNTQQAGKGRNKGETYDPEMSLVTRKAG